MFGIRCFKDELTGAAMAASDQEIPVVVCFAPEPPRTPSISDTSSSAGPITPESAGPVTPPSLKRSRSDDFDEPAVEHPSASPAASNQAQGGMMLSPMGAEARPMKMRKVVNALGWVTLGAVLGGVGTVAGLMQLAE